MKEYRARPAVKARQAARDKTTNADPEMKARKANRR